MSNPFCLCLAGPNGSGKSTFTGRLRDFYQLSNWIDPDVVAARHNGGQRGNVSEKASREAFKEARQKRVHHAARLEDFGFETVFSHSSNVEFLEALTILGYDVHVYFVCTESPEINIERVANRVRLGGHDVPRVKIVDRYKKSLLMAYYASRLVNKVRFFDNSPVNTHGRHVGDVSSSGSSIELRPAPLLPSWMVNSIVGRYAQRQNIKAPRFLTEQHFAYRSAKLDTVQQRQKFLSQFLIQEQ